MPTIWSSTVTRIGADAQDMIDAGVLILFGEPVPPALADVSIVHDHAQAATRDIAPGDTFRCGEQTFQVDAVGNLANTNLRELGHVVVYVNQPDQDLLPGALLATGEAPLAPSVSGSLAFEGA